VELRLSGAAKRRKAAPGDRPMRTTRTACARRGDGLPALGRVSTHLFSVKARLRPGDEACTAYFSHGTSIRSGRSSTPRAGAGTCRGCGGAAAPERGTPRLVGNSRTSPSGRRGDEAAHLAAPGRRRGDRPERARPCQWISPQIAAGETGSARGPRVHDEDDAE